MCSGHMGGDIVNENNHFLGRKLLVLIWPPTMLSVSLGIIMMRIRWCSDYDGAGAGCKVMQDK